MEMAMSVQTLRNLRQLKQTLECGRHWDDYDYDNYFKPDEFVAVLLSGIIMPNIMKTMNRRWGVITQHPGLGKFVKSLGKTLFRRIDQ